MQAWTMSLNNMVLSGSTGDANLALPVSMCTHPHGEVVLLYQEPKPTQMLNEYGIVSRW